ncbi:hypothetical protein ACRALDRAFT_1061220 [Sodiomyces alcalophilus JCM 7366]|uniref:uncharacterized protein n=1 Tax=Sodiomyces alcalophilus JCM 7366 TaxID=591952 RepID=UPI0039B4A929
MGLPLFVAPVDSDIKSKSPEKAPGVPPRTSIRRSRRSSNRESRTLRRRAAFLRESFPTYDLDAPSTRSIRPWENFGLPAPSEPPARYPWIESGQPPPPEAYTSNPPASRSAPGAHRHGRAARARVRTSSGNPTMSSLFGDRYTVIQTSTGDSPPPERGEPPTRSRLVARHPRPDDMDLSDMDGYRRDRIAPSVAARFDRSPDRGSRRSLHPSEGSASRGERASRTAPWPGSHRSTGLDGLGDRTRSLSPEVWDTLLTTLTPDPQPPSVESSFTSATASASASTSQNRSAAASSRTSFTGPDIVYNYGGEHPCENSDSDDEPVDEEADDGFDLSWATFPTAYTRRYVAALTANAYDSEVEWEAARRAVMARLMDE